MAIAELLQQPTAVLATKQHLGHHHLGLGLQRVRRHAGVELCHHQFVWQCHHQPHGLGHTRVGAVSKWQLHRQPKYFQHHQRGHLQPDLQQRHQLGELHHRQWHSQQLDGWQSGFGPVGHRHLQRHHIHHADFIHRDRFEKQRDHGAHRRHPERCQCGHSQQICHGHHGQYRQRQFQQLRRGDILQRHTQHHKHQHGNAQPDCTLSLCGGQLEWQPLQRQRLHRHLHQQRHGASRRQPDQRLRRCHRHRCRHLHLVVGRVLERLCLDQLQHASDHQCQFGGVAQDHHHHQHRVDHPLRCGDRLFKLGQPNPLHQHCLGGQRCDQHPHTNGQQNWRGTGRQLQRHARCCEFGFWQPQQLPLQLHQCQQHREPCVVDRGQLDGGIQGVRRHHGRLCDQWQLARRAGSRCEPGWLEPIGRFCQPQCGREHWLDIERHTDGRSSRQLHLNATHRLDRIDHTQIAHRHWTNRCQQSLRRNNHRDIDRRQLEWRGRI